MKTKLVGAAVLLLVAAGVTSPASANAPTGSAAAVKPPVVYDAPTVTLDSYTVTAAPAEPIFLASAAPAWTPSPGPITVPAPAVLEGRVDYPTYPRNPTSFTDPMPVYVGTLP